MESAINGQAVAAASRVRASVVGVDPLTIIEIIKTVIQQIIECRTRKEPDTSLVYEQLHDSYADNPNQSENQVRHRVIRESRRQGLRLRRPQTEEITDAIIEQGLEAQPEALMGCCAELSGIAPPEPAPVVE